ncbi:DUF695 domain-containing protein [Henriciella mobilis]|uniref:DUF695 domain-containing protein n=1 Tax=Henriciella mobilis TaxID=2305467 RepID=UPI000E6675E4|nr:DUF695 domain-containing protein [Henriciella mobilis]RIJ17837.1 DUF695 domain-containing protein [Henriciella mobilis]RIJ25350.1 DUF695 domain-containing protein [Henriciella mobilis]
MSDNWGLYCADMAGHTAFILFDDGISDEVDDLPQSFGLKIRVKLKDPRPDGLTTNEEAPTLNELEDRIKERVGDRGGILLGRVTTNSIRWILGLVHSPDVEPDIRGVLDAAGYTADIFISPDPKKSVYWDDLYPDVESRRVLKDMLVLEQLAEHGDDQDIVRRVDHWSYFGSKSTAQLFRDRLESDGYSIAAFEKLGPPLKREWLVHSHNECSMRLSDITRHTLRHLRSAIHYGGRYDGWETRVERNEEA